MLDLTIRTLQGSCKFAAVSPNLTVAAFKTQLHEAAAAMQLSGLKIPFPENQNIVYNGRALHDGSLEDAGIQSGDSVVVLSIPTPNPPRKEEPQKGPSAEEIAEAIKAYAVKHGLESKLTAPDRPRPRRGGHMHDPASLGADQLQVIFDVLEESLGRRTAAPNPEPEEEEDFHVPEPDPRHMQSLTEEMGIATEIAAKALILHRNNLTVRSESSPVGSGVALQAALNWICEHQDDEDVTAPIPDATLRALYGRRREPRSLAVRPDRLQSLLDMGFEEDQAREALMRTRNNMELAVSSLLHQPATGSPALVPETPTPLPSSETLTPVEEQIPPTDETRSQESGPVTSPSDQSEGMRCPGPPPAAAQSGEGLTWAEVDAEAAEEMSEEPPSSEVEVSLVGEGDDDLLVVPGDFDQGELGGVSLGDVERALGGDIQGGRPSEVYPEIRRLLEHFDVRLPENISDDADEVSRDRDTATFLMRLRELLNVLGSSGQNEGDPFGAGPSGESQDNA